MQPLFKTPSEASEKARGQVAARVKSVGGNPGPVADEGGAGRLPLAGPGVGVGGAPKSRAGAYNLDRFPSNPKNQNDSWNNSDSPVTEQPEVVPMPVNEGPRSEAEWMKRPHWPPRKRPLDKKGWNKNHEEIHYLIDRASAAPIPSDELEQALAVGTKKALWTQEFKDFLYEWIASGRPLLQITRKYGVGYGQMQTWIKSDPVMAERMKEARSVAVEALVEQSLDMASNPLMQQETIEQFNKDGEVTSRAVKTFDNVYARKLAINTRMLLAAKWAPSKYGEKPEEEVTSSQAERILAARRRVAEERLEHGRGGESVAEERLGQAQGEGSQGEDDGAEDPGRD